MATEAQDQPAPPGGGAEWATPSVDRHGALTVRRGLNTMLFLSIAYDDILQVVELWSWPCPAPEHPRLLLAPLA